MNNFLYKTFSWISVMAVFSALPYITWYLFGNFYFIISAVLSSATFVFFLLFKYDLRLDNWNIVILAMGLSMVIYSGFITLRDNSTIEIRHVVGFVFKILFIWGVSILLKKNYTYITKIFFNINTLITCLSVLLFFLLLSGIVIQPIAFTKMDMRPHYFFWIGATNTLLDFGAIIIRIAGFADEPGAFALILTYLIVINELTFKSNLYRWIFCIGGVLTFSIAFVISMAPIVIYWLFSRMISIKKILLVSLIVISVSGYIENSDSAISLGMEKLLVDRFLVSDDGELEGDNRSWAIPYQKEGFAKYPLLGTGSDPDAMEEYKLGYPNFYSFLASWGIYGYIFFYMPFIFLIFKFINRKELLLLIAIGMNFLQRPGIEHLFSLFALTLIYYSFLFNENKSENIRYYGRLQRCR